MALAETAKLAVQLDLKDKLTGGLRKASSSLSRFGVNTGRIAELSKRGLTNTVGNLAKIGAIAAVGIAAMVKSGLSDLATLESAVTSVDGAIKQMGLTGQVTGAQIATWANEIEAATQAAFDDKAIAASTANLIRYGKVTSDNLRPAMVVMTDLAAKTGDVEGASNLLAKALANPAKAAGKLARMGIYLSDSQQSQIEKMMKAGDLAGAQSLLLNALAASTTGAASAMNGPYADALNTFNDVMEDARKALAIGFMPVLQKVANLLSTELAKPETLAAIKQFGQGLATGFDKLIEIARNLPWGAIGSSLQLAGQGATAVLNAFASLPPWVQTAVLTGWGLNKLSGGALGGIVGELGKGLIKGVLGMTAGVVNINAGVVNGGGGKLPIPGGGGGGAPVVGGASGFAAVVASMGGMAALASVAAAAVPAAAMLAAPYIFQGEKGSGIKPISTPGGGTISYQNAGMAYGNSPALLNAMNQVAGKQQVTNNLLSLDRGQQAAANRMTAMANMYHQREVAELGQTKQATRAGNAKLNGANAKLSAIARKKMQFTNRITIPVNLSIRTVQGMNRITDRVNHHSAYHGK